MEEVLQSRETRALSGFLFSVTGEGGNQRLTNLRLTDGRPLDPSRRYRIAMNTFDASSGGHRFMKLRALLETRAARCTFHPVQTREAMIDYFRRHNPVHKITLQEGAVAVA